MSTFEEYLEQVQRFDIDSILEYLGFSSLGDLFIAIEENKYSLKEVTGYIPSRNMFKTEEDFVMEIINIFHDDLEELKNNIT